jgi:hypothetical protein
MENDSGESSVRALRLASVTQRRTGTMPINPPVIPSSLGVVLGLFVAPPTMPMADRSGDPKGISKPLSQSKTEAMERQNDAAGRETFPRAYRGWGSHAAIPEDLAVPVRGGARGLTGYPETLKLQETRRNP